MQRKIGVIRSWHETRGFGIIRVGDRSSLERYWLHVSRIRSGTATPVPGMTVEFDVSTTAPKKDGDLWAAINADIDVESQSAPSDKAVL
jgi:cold shock CspA family protein